jgi:LAO/AO transport system kinase
MLIVQDAIPQPEIVNPDAIKNIRLRKKKKYTCDEYVTGILNGNRVIMGQAITLVESLLPEHNELAQQIIERCLPYSGKSIRIGVTGVPGAGKSTFIEAFGKYLTSLGHKVAVLAIDPSSTRTRGSILGDKTRMEDLSTDENAFIRPSPSAGTLGGVARKTHEIIFLCEAAGFDVVLVETVGVGQSETAVHSMVDFFLLVLIAGAGDELQGIKRGIMEMADAIIINKADGDNIDKANLAARSYANALHLFPPTDSGWTPKVLTCSSIQNHGVSDIWTMISDYKSLTTTNDYFYIKRNKQSLDVMYSTINEQIKYKFYNNEAVMEKIPEIEKSVISGKCSSYTAAKKLLDIVK